MSLDTTTFRMGPSQGFPAVIRRLGHDPQPILALAGLDERMFDHAENRVEVRIIGRFAHLAARQTGREDIGLLLAENFGIEQLGLLGLVMAEGPDVRTSLRNLCRLLHYNSRAAMLSLLVGDRDATLKYDLRDSDVEGASIIMDSVVGMMMRAMRRLCGRNWVPLEVHLSRRRPKDMQSYTSYFQAPLRFNSVQDAIVFRVADLDRPVPSGSAEKPSGAGIQPPALEERVRHCLAATLGLEEVTVATVADSLGLSRRSLIRHLLSENTSFQIILDEVRSRRAKHLLSRGDAPIAEIAFALGFGDASVFTRSFRRWTGSSPSAWRAQNRSA